MTKRVGELGEDLASRHLRTLGYRIVERNFRCPLGEIDCVAVKGKTLVFCEVKTRRSNRYGGPLVPMSERVKKPKAKKRPPKKS